jgi:hypothetical protein
MRAAGGRRVVTVLVGLVVALVASTADVRAYQPGTQLFTFQDGRITESSGVASASYRDDLIYTHNDSGDTPRFFAVDFTGATVGHYRIGNAKAVDWEDMARGPHSNGSPGSSLYFGDIGNNFRNRGVLSVYEVDEPVVGVTGEWLPLRRVFKLHYKDIRHDAEALLVNPVTRELLVVAKEFHGVSNVYVANGNVLRSVAKVPIAALMTRSPDAINGPLSGTQVTGGDISPDGSKLVLRTYLEAFEWPLIGNDYKASLAASPTKIALPKTQQGEAIAYARDGLSLLVTSEGTHAPVHRIAS